MEVATFSPLLNELINALRCLPGVGPKTAQRMAFYLLQRHKDNARHLAQTLSLAVNNIAQCNHCRILTELDICQLCNDNKREDHTLCIVENPSDVIAIEQTATFRGRYFVLMGYLSPLDGIGPEHLGIDKLLMRLRQGTWQEIIIATNPTIEGEATAHYLTETIKPFHIKTSRIALGVPFGGELEYIDGGTLSRALLRREVLQQ